MRHEPAAVDGLTHASSVIPVVRSSEGESLTLTRSSIPSNDSARPKRPAVVRVAPAIVPALPAGELSATLVPLASSKP